MARITVPVETTSDNKLSRYWSRKLLGKCTECGARPPMIGKLKCANCVGVTKTRYGKVNYYEHYKSLGICTRCCTTPVEEQGKALCVACREVQNAQNRKSDHKFRERQKVVSQKRYLAGLCRFCDKPRERDTVRCQYHLEATRISNRKPFETVLDHYGRQCKCCGETRREFLSLDHVNNDGHQHRQRLGYSKVFVDVIKQGFPDTFQILCFNCNFARGHSVDHKCPHEREKEGQR